MAAVQQLSAAYPLGSRLNEAGALEIGGCDARDVAREFGTPCYVVAEDDLRARARAFRDAFRARTDRFDVLFATKAFPCTAVLRVLREEGLGCDVASAGELHLALGAGVLDDVAAMAALLPAGAPLALRGSSMGGYLAIVAAEHVAARAVVAICPASAEALRRGLRSGALDFRADAGPLDAFLAEHDDLLAIGALELPLLLLHAEGDERVPVEHSRELARAAPDARLIALPGGHHRSVQHDGELQGEALRWLDKVL